MAKEWAGLGPQNQGPVDGQGAGGPDIEQRERLENGIVYFGVALVWEDFKKVRFGNPGRFEILVCTGSVAGQVH